MPQRLRQKAAATGKVAVAAGELGSVASVGVDAPSLVTPPRGPRGLPLDALLESLVRDMVLRHRVPHALHSVGLPGGPLRHCGDSVARQ